MTPYHGHSNNPPLLRAFFLNGSSPLAWPDSTERASRLGAKLQGGRAKEGWKRNDGEGHTCFCGLRALMWRERPPRRVLFSQTAHRESGRWLGKRHRRGREDSCLHRGCFGCSFLFTFGIQPFTNHNHRLPGTPSGERLTSGSISMKRWMLASLATRSISSWDTTRLLSP